MASIKGDVRAELYRDISIHLLEMLECHGLIAEDLSNDQREIVNGLINDTVDAIGETVASQTFTIENDGIEPEHTLFAFDGTPCCSLDCMCEMCLNYFANN